MNIGLPEIIIIIVIVVALFGIAWVVKNRRRSSRPNNTNASTQDKAKQ